MVLCTCRFSYLAWIGFFSIQLYSRKWIDSFKSPWSNYLLLGCLAQTNLLTANCGLFLAYSNLTGYGVPPIEF